jgi:small conductance mechanosensitive channel
MKELHIGEFDLLSTFRPDTLLGALIYLALFLLVAALLTRGLRAAVHTAMIRKGHFDRTTISFLQQMGSALIWVIFLILYAHLIPVLRSMGTALLAGASIASVVIGLAAQSTLGNLVAGIAITIYRPFRLGDTVQVAAPTGTETGCVELITLGYTRLRTSDGRLVVLPNALAASQVSINLGSSAVRAPIAVTLKVPRSTDLSVLSKEAQQIAESVLDADAHPQVFVTGYEATSAVITVRAHTAAGASSDEMRARLMSALEKRLSGVPNLFHDGQLPLLS